MKGEADLNNAYLEIHAGAGGTESQDWAEMLQRMYLRWAESKSLSVSLFSPSINCKGNTPIPIKFERCILSKLSAITAFIPNNLVPLAAQSLDEPVPYSFPAKTTNGIFFFSYSIAAS